MVVALTVFCLLSHLVTSSVKHSERSPRWCRTAPPGLQRLSLCPALASCRAWVTALPRQEVPFGVTAGMVKPRADR
jgi:hypothetical protein